MACSVNHISCLSGTILSIAYPCDGIMM
jgi:hypothetical protein